MEQSGTLELPDAQLDRAALLDRVLRRDDEERRRQLEGLLADRDLALLHGLEQRTLDLRRRAVDLVGEQQVGEDRALVDVERVVALVEDLAAEDVARQQVDGELHARELQRDRARQRRR